MQHSQFWAGKKALITGGTSGLGRALAGELHRRGADVAIVARNPPLVQNFHFIQGDVSDQRQIHRIHAEALSHLGSIDVLFNNASRLGPTPLRLLLDTECEDLARVLETNLLGPFRLTKLVLPGMILNRFGIIVNISSDAAVNAYPTWGSYGASKAALDHLTRVFDVELAGTGVKLLALDPGDMDTPMHAAAVPDADRGALRRPEDSAALIADQLEAERFQPIRRSIR